MDDREKKKTTEGVINELRNVISNLHLAPISQETPPEPMAEPDLPPVRNQPSPAVVNPVEPVVPPNDELPANDLPPSDTDFWKGNVLGWPAGGESKPEFQEPPPPSLSDRNFLMDDLPESPTKPAPVFEKLPVEPDEPVQPVESVLLDIPEPPPIPIPGTWTGEEKPSAPEAPQLDLDVIDKKPQGLVQIACVYPEGEEKLGQQFVNKLRELAEKAKGRLNIQMVFVSGWNIQNVDLSAWIKSATLSGADVMFVLSAKKDLELFKGFKLDPLNDGIKTRFVMLEHLGLRTLYPDILIELQRGS